MGLIAAGAAATSLALSAVPAQAASSYVALGDSYSSGTGTRDYINDGTQCLRSTKAYPSLIAAAKGYSLNFRACSGATIPDVTNTQLSALSASTTHVSISIGGNDAGFADVLTECAMPGWASNCNGAINTAQSYITNTLPGRLSTLYTSIRSKAPNARVVVVGYPRIFMGEDCNAFTWFSPSEQSRLNQTADLINSKTSAAAAAKGFSFANPTSRFVGHAVCDSPEWLNGLSNPIVESYHPNVAGHRDGYTPTVSTPLTGSTVKVNGKVARAADASAERLAARQRTYAGQDASITPKQFRVPDLTTAAVKAAAARAGVNLNSRASIDAADRVWSQRQAVSNN
ncbi:SGNH/GDSL hydrolase family protein [Knoellia subterranea]|nr:SGNH/GDSL hydrolase family protein [Knoellia subterranea]